MRKVFGLITAFMLLLQLTTPPSASAYSGGMLNGRTGYENKFNMWNIDLTGSAVTSLTDNNETTSFTLAPSNANTPVHAVDFTTSSARTVMSYRIKASAGANLRIRVFTSQINAMDEFPVNTDGFRHNTPYIENNITCVKIYNYGSTQATIYEVDLFSGTVPTTPPSVPTGLQVTPDDSQVTLAWKPNTEPDLSGYYLYEDGVKLNIPILTQTNYLLTGLKNGRAYNFTLAALDANNNLSAQSAPVLATPVLSNVINLLRGTNSINPKCFIVNYDVGTTISSQKLLPLGYATLKTP
jgi:hypothetical protein